MLDLLDKASDAYYRGEPIMSDAQFDILAAHFNYGRVGHQITDGIPHFYRMYSLQNIFDISDFPDTTGYIPSNKLDGAAVSLLYINGKLSLALTRGDGIHGRDITEKLKLLVPQRIDTPDIIQITGEVLAPKKIKNSRNFAAGSLNLKDLEEFKKRPLVFVAYGVSSHGWTWSWDMENLASKGFSTVLDFDITDYPTDGVVYRIDDNAEFKKMGYTAKHPRGAFAYKIQAKGVVTELLDVIWQVGKSGVVSPVAILEPVEIGGALVSRATLHNIKYITDLDLEIGCNVEVIRSGEIIPRVVRRV